MSSDEDEPAPSPSAAVVARRASREAKSMREESGSDEDAEEPEDWEDDGGEASSEEDESVEELRGGAELSGAGPAGRSLSHFCDSPTTFLRLKFITFFFAPPRMKRNRLP